MREVRLIMLMALVMVIALSGSAFAGITAVPEPGSLALLAVGVGALAGVKYFTRKPPE